MADVLEAQARLGRGMALGAADEQVVHGIEIETDGLAERGQLQWVLIGRARDGLDDRDRDRFPTVDVVVCAVDLAAGLGRLLGVGLSHRPGAPDDRHRSFDPLFVRSRGHPANDERTMRRS
jgi:hypothetical protein